MSAYPDFTAERRERPIPQILDPQNQLRILPPTLPDSGSAWNPLKGGNIVSFDSGFSGPPSQNPLAESSGFERKILDAAKKLTQLPDDWDDNGGTAYSEAHVARVASFVTSIIECIPLYGRRLALLPQISPGPGTSIDVFWQLPKRELLLNFPSDVSGFVTYSGEALGGERAEIRGSLDANYSNEWLAIWLFGHDADRGAYNRSTPAYAFVEQNQPKAALSQL